MQDCVAQVANTQTVSSNIYSIHIEYGNIVGVSKLSKLLCYVSIHKSCVLQLHVVGSSGPTSCCTSTASLCNSLPYHED